MLPPGECYYNTLLCCHYFSSSSVVSCAFSALCMYSKFKHHPHPLGYLCANFHFFHSLHCWASPWRKTAYSITQSLSLLIWCPGNQSACALEKKDLNWKDYKVNAIQIDLRKSSLSAGLRFNRPHNRSFSSSLVLAGMLHHAHAHKNNQFWVFS